jgi:glycolate oxidase FAD binding subunit
MSSEAPARSIDGVAAAQAESPSSVAELAALLADTSGSVVTIGGGTRIGQGNPPESVDLLVMTGRLDRIVEHAAGDLVVTVQPGVRLHELQEALAPSGQWLALDPAGEDATVGGIVAAAASGPRRLRWGTPRDFLIGLSVVLADGTVARSGGKVVKNVAGYDLGKLFAGSFGSLGVIAECTLRLHPRPRAARFVSWVPADLASAVALSTSTGLQPSAIEWDGSRLVVALEGNEPVVTAQAESLAALAGTELPPDITASAPAGFGEQPWRAVATGVGLTFTHRLGELAAALAAIHRLLPSALVRAHAGSGVVRIGTDAQGLGALPGLRRAAAELDGQVVVVAASAEAKAGVDVWGPARGFEVMRRIKAQFDPDRRMSPGRFVGGL